MYVIQLEITSVTLQINMQSKKSQWSLGARYSSIKLNLQKIIRKMDVFSFSVTEYSMWPDYRWWGNICFRWADICKSLFLHYWNGFSHERVLVSITNFDKLTVIFPIALNSYWCRLLLWLWTVKYAKLFEKFTKYWFCVYFIHFTWTLAILEKLLHIQFLYYLSNISSVHWSVGNDFLKSKKECSLSKLCNKHQLNIWCSE